jgi:hypothetical protein
MVVEDGHTKQTAFGMVQQEEAVPQSKLFQERTMLSQVVAQEVEVERKVEREVFSREATANLRETMDEDGVELKHQEERQAQQHPFQAALEV